MAGGVSVDWKISIHAPRAGRDAKGFRFAPIHGDFNPRAPRGARHTYKMTPQRLV